MEVIYLILKDFLEIEPKSKKHLMKVLTNHNILYKHKKKNIIIENLSLDDYLNLTVIYSTYYNNVYSVKIIFNKNDYTISQVKEKMIQLFGIPKRDNTKHNLDYICVHWNYNNRYIFLDTSNDRNEIALVYNFPTKDLSKESNKFTFIVSMICGFLWGILFFLIYGIDIGHTLFLFTLSMVGGIFIGLMFGICMLKMNSYMPKTKNYNITEKDKKIFIEYEKENRITLEGSYCVISKFYKNKNHYYKSKMYFYNDEIIILLLNKRTIKLDVKKIKSIKRYYSSSSYKNIVIMFHDTTSICLSNMENYEEVINILDRFLGYDTDRFNDIKSIVYNNLIEFDPDDILVGGAPKELFMSDAKSIAMEIYDRSRISVNDIKYILERTSMNCLENFGFDVSIEYDLLSLAIQIYDDLKLKNIIDN